MALSKELGFEQPGSDLTRFNSKSELETHIEIIHGGRKAYWQKVNDAKRMSEIRRPDKLNRDMDVSTNQEGSGQDE